MKRIFYPLVTVFIFFSSIYASANRIDDFNLKNYVYDDEGNPVFVKVYIKSPKAKFSDQDWSDSFSQQDSLPHLLNLMTQDDQGGSYLVVPIKKKKDKDDDDDKDESVWECPYCGTINESFRNTCKKKGCVLYR
jgi:hypothetical protein